MTPVLTMKTSTTAGRNPDIVADDKDGGGALRYFDVDGTWASRSEESGFGVLEFDFFDTPHE